MPTCQGRPSGPVHEITAYCYQGNKVTDKYVYAQNLARGRKSAAQLRNAIIQSPNKRKGTVKSTVKLIPPRRG